MKDLSLVAARSGFACEFLQGFERFLSGFTLLLSGFAHVSSVFDTFLSGSTTYEYFLKKILFQTNLFILQWRVGMTAATNRVICIITSNLNLIPCVYRLFIFINTQVHSCLFMAEPADGFHFFNFVGVR